ncbi:vanadium-dependent haloperoxidase [Tahibacter amnicola]|uniref:Vanadium-dependent haloperoxidase n=1 Tax=Tahibacter amnicola TaxID=2976241 RepID=A0ABY6BL64_9GAMM|nr:vanadium-dependent haloperoxidase [Tahibacter amnicola]UXI70605.1 vanadium-dependent haloperoxidase [Tahibacter amnicola]
MMLRHCSPRASFRRFVGFMVVMVAGVASAGTLLDYPRSTGRDTTIAVPQTAFHDWQAAESEAATLVEAWKTEPVTLPWTRLQLARYIKHKAMPTRGARGLALMHVAMYDGHQLAIARKLDAKLVVSAAAARVLGYQFTAEERAFDRIAYSVAAQLSGTTRETLPPAALDALRLGYGVGEKVVARAETDGAQRGWNGSRLQWYGDDRYYGPGSWEPTPPYFYYPPDEPFAPGWKTWVLKRADQFRPTPPPFGSERYLKDVQEVVAIHTSRTDEQLRIAKFWVDGHGSVTPPGHWNQIAMDEVKKARLDDATTARLFAEINIAMADTFIAVWDTKYHYWTMRPITAAKKLLGQELKLPILTPPFPSYVSGHAGFSGAAARILGNYFPQEAERLDTMAEEAAASRLYGGIHFRHDNEDGLALGRKIADEVLRWRESR